MLIGKNWSQLDYISCVSTFSMYMRGCGIGERGRERERERKRICLYWETGGMLYSLSLCVREWERWESEWVSACGRVLCVYLKKNCWILN